MEVDKMKKLIFSFIITILALTTLQPSLIEAKTLEEFKFYKVKNDDTYYKIALQFGVSELELKELNPSNKGKLKRGELILIPKTLSNKEKDLLARLVHAEAKGEPFAGKVAVAQVVLNRVEHEQFPDTVEKVIKQEGQFDPVENGEIKKPATEKDKKAVKIALAKEGQGDGSLYFFNPEIAQNHWQDSRKTTKIIGNHQFAK